MATIPTTALPTTPGTSWVQGLDFPSRLFETGSNDCELYEEDGEFVLSVELPGFDPEEITVTWDDGVLNIAAEHENEKTRRVVSARSTIAASGSPRTSTRGCTV